MQTTMKQKYKNTELTAKKCINSIVRFYKQATTIEIKDGKNWYTEANQYCRELAQRFNITIQQAAGIIAVFSPQAGWVENKRYTVTYLLNPALQLRSLPQQIKANKIITLKSETDIYNVLSTQDKAFKTKAFFVNMLNPDIVTGVTIDRHAIAICLQHPANVYALGVEYSQLTKQQYNFFEQCYMNAAKILGVLPHELQAITWVTYRRLRDLRSHETNTQWQPFQTETTF
jgi:hypothetical protein